VTWRVELEPGSYRRRLVDSLPLDTFVDLAKMDTIHSLTEILLLSATTTAEIPLEFRPVGDLPFGSIDLITCGGLPCGYVIGVPRCSRIIGRNYASLIRRNPIDAEVSQLFVDGKLVVVGNDSAMVATIATRRWIGQ
jgi:hypothetical protein